MKKKKLKLRKIGINVSLILIGLVLLLSFMIIKLNVLPTLYILIYLAVIVFITSGLVKVMLINSYKIWLKYICIFLSIVLSIIMFIGILYIFKTYNFMDKIKGKGIYENYYVVVKKDSRYSDIGSLSMIYTYNEYTDAYKEALEKLNKKVEEVSSIDTLKNKLINGSADAILLSNVMKDYIEEEDSSFKDKTKIIHTIKVKIDEVDATSNVDISKNPFTIYVSGIDTYGDIELRSRSDVNMLVTVNPNTHEVLLTSIPRDYYVRLHNTTGYKDKLTHAGIYGVNMSIATIEDLLDIDINYYVRVNFSTLVDVVDTIDGIDVYSDRTFNPYTNKSITIYKGMNHMDGDTALAYSRERYAYEEGDRHRVANQQDVITAIIKKLTSSKTLLTKYTSILDSISKSFQTNIEMDDLSSIARLQLKDMPTWNISRYSLNGTGDMDYTYSMGSQKLYVMLPDYDTVDEATSYIKGIIDGKSLSELGL